MKKSILLTTILLSSLHVYASTCTPPNPPKCECAYPIFKDGFLDCGESYCGDKKCMPDGSCCTTPNRLKTECCDEKGNDVATDGTCCPALDKSDCETEIDTLTGCKVCKSICEVDQVPCVLGSDSWCCDAGNSCGAVGQCCEGGYCCSNGEKPYTYFVYNSPSTGDVTGCCLLDPETTPKEPEATNDQAKRSRLCCTAAKPIYHKYRFLGTRWDYDCFEGEPELTGCSNAATSTAEDCLNATGSMLTYGYCSKGYGEWSRVSQTINWTRSCL